MVLEAEKEWGSGRLPVLDQVGEQGFPGVRGRTTILGVGQPQRQEGPYVLPCLGHILIRTAGTVSSGQVTQRGERPTEACGRGYTGRKAQEPQVPRASSGPLQATWPALSFLPFLGVPPCQS